MTPGELNAIEARCCIDKVQHTPRRARRIASEVGDLQAYACPFCDSWHVGHPLSWAGVEQLAEAIRFRAYPQGAHIDRQAG